MHRERKVIGNRVTYRQQLVLRQALASYRFAVATLTEAGVEVPPGVADWGKELAGTRVTVLVRCVVCRDSFPKTTTLGFGAHEEEICPGCMAELEAMRRDR